MTCVRGQRVGNAVPSSRFGASSEHFSMVVGFKSEAGVQKRQKGLTRTQPREKPHPRRTLSSWRVIRPTRAAEWVFLADGLRVCPSGRVISGLWEGHGLFGGRSAAVRETRMQNDTTEHGFRTDDRYRQQAGGEKR